MYKYTQQACYVKVYLHDMITLDQNNNMINYGHTHTAWDMVAYITKYGNKSRKQCSYVGHTMRISVVDKKGHGIC